MLAFLPVLSVSAVPYEKTSDFISASVGEAHLASPSDENYPDCKFPHTAEAVARREGIGGGDASEGHGKKSSASVINYWATPRLATGTKPMGLPKGKSGGSSLW